MGPLLCEGSTDRPAHLIHHKKWDRYQRQGTRQVVGIQVRFVTWQLNEISSANLFAWCEREM